MKKHTTVLSLCCLLVVSVMAHAAPEAAIGTKSVTQYDCTPDGKPGLRLMIMEGDPAKHIEFRIYNSASEMALKTPLLFKANEAPRGLLMSCEENVCSQTGGKLTVNAVKDGEFMEGDYAWTDLFTKKETAGRFKSRWDKANIECGAKRARK